MFYYYYDWYYIVLVLPCVLFSLIASAMVKFTFKKYAKQLSGRRITGAEAAKRVLLMNGVTNVQVQTVQGSLTDHYDPKANVIRLSDDVYSSTSTAAIGVACHEAGHAVQYANGYVPIKLRAAVIPLTNIGSKLALPLILLGLILPVFEFISPEISAFLVNFGIACFGMALVFQLVTLPVEFNASRRAMAAIKDADLLSPDEQRGARRTLTAAAMTYVAATAVALAQLLRLVLLFSKRDD